MQSENSANDTNVKSADDTAKENVKNKEKPKANATTKAKEKVQETTKTRVTKVVRPTPMRFRPVRRAERELVAGCERLTIGSADGEMKKEEKERGKKDVVMKVCEVEGEMNMEEQGKVLLDDTNAAGVE